MQDRRISACYILAGLGYHTMDTIKAEHDINELKLQSLKREVDKVQQASPPAGLADGSNSNTPTHASTLSPPPNNTNGSAGGPAKPSRSPVDIASQLFSRNKSKSSNKSKKRSSPRGRATPPAVATTNGQHATSDIDQLRQQIQDTQENEMKLVSSAIGINPDGTALTEEGHDDVLDLADQLLAQLDAKEDMIPNQPVSSSSNSGIASGPTTSSNPPLAAPQPINTANVNMNAQNGGVMASMDGGSSLQHASSRQSATSSTSAMSSASTTIPVTIPANASSSRSRHSSSSSAPKPTGFGAKLKQALSPHRDESPTSPSPDGGDVSSEATSNTGGTSSTSPFSAQTFKNRHALRKEKKKQKEDAMRAEAQAEVEAERANGGVNNKYDAADLERINIDNICRSWNLELIEMEPDGHCMYSAIADQLISKKITLGDKKEKKKEKEKWDYNAVRKIAAEYMRAHMDDFLPYIPAEDIEGQGEGLLSPEGYMKHCDNVENTSEWGSQTELLALSKALQLPIWVIQAHSPTVKIGTEEAYAKKKSPLIVTYHRVQYGLGEHYNSARVMPRESGMVYLG